MTMKVELFTTLEEYVGNPEQDDAAAARALKLVEELDFEGQKGLFGQDLLNPKQFPFRPMRHDEQVVYSLLLPQKTDAQKYDGERIPTRVLELALTAKRCGLFKELVVWHQSAVTPDPVLVGMKQHPQWTWTTTPYMIARWGEVLESFSVLTERALGLWKAKRTAFLKEVFRLAKREHQRTAEMDVQTFGACAEEIIGSLSEHHGIRSIAVKEMRV